MSYLFAVGIQSGSSCCVFRDLHNTGTGEFKHILPLKHVCNLKYMYVQAYKPFTLFQIHNCAVILISLSRMISIKVVWYPNYMCMHIMEMDYRPGHLTAKIICYKINFMQVCSGRHY